MLGNPLVLHPSAAHLGLGTHQALLLPLQLLQGGLRRQGGLQLSHQLGALRCRLLQLGGGSCRQLRCLQGRARHGGASVSQPPARGTRQVRHIEQPRGSRRRGGQAGGARRAAPPNERRALRRTSAVACRASSSCAFSSCCSLPDWAAASRASSFTRSDVAAATWDWRAMARWSAASRSFSAAASCAFQSSACRAGMGQRTAVDRCQTQPLRCCAAPRGQGRAAGVPAGPSGHGLSPPWRRQPWPPARQPGPPPARQPGPRPGPAPAAARRCGPLPPSMQPPCQQPAAGSTTTGSHSKPWSTHGCWEW